MYQGPENSLFLHHRPPPRLDTSFLLLQCLHSQHGANILARDPRGLELPCAVPHTRLVHNLQGGTIQFRFHAIRKWCPGPGYCLGPSICGTSKPNDFPTIQVDSSAATFAVFSRSSDSLDDRGLAAGAASFKKVDPPSFCLGCGRTFSGDCLGLEAGRAPGADALMRVFRNRDPGVEYLRSSGYEHVV